MSTDRTIRYGIGDTIVCVDDVASSSKIKNGKKYRVIGAYYADGEYIKVEDAETGEVIDCYFYPWRFIKYRSLKINII